MAVLVSKGFPYESLLRNDKLCCGVSKLSKLRALVGALIVHVRGVLSQQSEQPYNQHTFSLHATNNNKLNVVFSLTNFKQFLLYLQFHTR